MKPRFVTFHYNLKDTQGKLLDSSYQGEPMMFLEGRSQILPALECGLKNLTVGDKGEIALRRTEAYGPRNEKLVIRVPLEKLPNQSRVRLGQKFSLNTKELGQQIFRVIELSPVDALLDANHPFAGKDLVFEVEILEIREATRADAFYHVNALAPNQSRTN